MTEHQEALQRLAQEYEQKLALLELEKGELKHALEESQLDCKRYIERYVLIRRAMQLLLQSE